MPSRGHSSASSTAIGIPDSGRRRALIVVDVQPAFARSDHGVAAQRIARIVSSVPYDGYLEALFFIDRRSLWVRQAGERPMRRGPDFRTVAPLGAMLRRAKALRVEKQTKSIFHDPAADRYLRARRIEEVHIVGYDTDDCVLTTAEDAFDRGYYTYVIEEATASSSGPAMRRHALAILRNVHLTNRACIERLPFRNVRLNRQPLDKSPYIGYTPGE